MEKENKLGMNLQLFAESAETGENGQESTEGANTSKGTETGENEGNNKPKEENGDKEKEKETLFTQEQVDKIVQERLKRATKANKNANSTGEQVDLDEIKAMKEQMQDAISENYALKRGVPDDKLAYVIKLAKTVDDTDDYKASIDKVLEEFPFLAKKEEPKEAEQSAGNVVKATVGKAGGNGKKMNKADIMAIKDVKKRHKAIAENIELFK